eukprot:728164-Pelagomonas_calceolata.AAC.4
MQPAPHSAPVPQPVGCGRTAALAAAELLAAAPLSAAVLALRQMPLAPHSVSVPQPIGCAPPAAHAAAKLLAAAPLPADASKVLRLLQLLLLLVLPLPAPLSAPPNAPLIAPASLTAPALAFVPPAAALAHPSVAAPAGWRAPRLHALLLQPLPPQLPGPPGVPAPVAEHLQAALAPLPVGAPGQRKDLHQSRLCSCLLH